MRKLPKSGELAKLQQLTGARELAAMAELADINAKKARIEDQIAWLSAMDVAS